MKITLASTKLDWHGGEEQLRQLALGLLSRGHDCAVLAPAASEMIRRLGRDGVPVHSFPGSGGSPRAIWQMRCHLERNRPDVLHFNDANAVTTTGAASMGLGIAARVAARRVDFPPAFLLQYRLVDRVICVSHAVARVCARSGLPSDRLCVVHSGVDPQRMAGGDRCRGRGILGIGDHTSLLLTVAKLSDHKGHRYLLEAMPAVLEQYPDTCLVLAGDGELQRDLRVVASRLRILSSVRFLGYRDDVPDLLAACDLFVMPSHKEGLCSSLIDAMFARCPIVATDAGGIPEIVGSDLGGERSVGYLVPPRDPISLGAAIVRSLAASETSARMAQWALDRVCSRFTADHMVEATLDVYRKIMTVRADTISREGKPSLPGD